MKVYCRSAWKASFFVLLLALSQPSHAFWSLCEKAFSRFQEGRSLKSIEKNFSQLPRNLEISVRANEITSGVGELVKDSKTLAQLTDGEYPFLIDANGQILFSERTPRWGESASLVQHLATHRSLFIYLQSLTPQREVAVIAAGAFRITNGRVGEISNRAGTFNKGNDVSRLEYSVRKLRHAGLAVEDKTWIRLASPNAPRDKAHFSESKISEFTVRFKGTAEYKELAYIFSELARLFPDSQKPGFYDERALKNLAQQWRRQALRNRSREDLVKLADLEQLLATAPYFQHEEYGIAVVTHQLMETKSGPASYTQTLAGFRELLIRMKR